VTKPVGLAILSSDALSSVAYATEEMIKVLLPVAGLAAFSLGVPLAGAIILLLLTLVFSYRQTIRAYPSAGGAYIVTKDNFGLLPAQVAGAALLIDYVMTVSVSIAAGVAAMYSQFPGLFAVRIPVAIAFVWLIAWTNLRGVRMVGRIFATPTYLFLLSILGLVAVGTLRALTGGLHRLPPPPGVHLTDSAGAVGLFVLMHAYASGTTALTGVEAISNGVTVFRPPEWRNARTVLTWMGAILAVAFGAITLLSWRVHPVPTAHQTLVSVLGRAIFGNGSIGRFAHLGLQVTTTAILVLAANTSFSDFPRLASFHAADGYLPRPLRRRGRRLAFSTGIVVLASTATATLLVLGADVHRLIPLYAVGVFASFTFSQAGMSVRHLRLREEGWRHSLVINAAGAVGSGLALLAVSITKFSHGAWAVLVLVPLGVTLFVGIHRHYETTERRLEELGSGVRDETLGVAVVVNRRQVQVDAALQYARAVGAADVRRLDVRSMRAAVRALRDLESRGGRVLVVLARRPGPAPRNPFSFERRLRRRLARDEGMAAATVTQFPADRSQAPVRHAVIVVVQDADGLARRSVAVARALRANELHAVFVDVDRERTDAVVDAWGRGRFPVPLEVVAAPYRDPGGAVRWKVETLRGKGAHLVSVVTGEVAPRWWQRPLYKADSLRVHAALATVPGTAVVEAPYPL
jgi:amino acid transporter